MTAEGVKVEGEEEISYTPGIMARPCLDQTKALGGKRQRFMSSLGVVQAILDEMGQWHFYNGT